MPKDSVATVIALATLIVASLSIPDRDLAKLVFLSLTFLILALAVFWRFRNVVRDSQALIKERWQGIDCQRRTLPTRILCFLFRPLARALRHILVKPLFWVGVYGFVIGVILWGSHVVLQPAQATTLRQYLYNSLGFTATVGPVTLVIWLTYIMFRRWERNVEQQTPFQMVTQQIERVIRRYSGGAAAITLRRTVAVEDPGPVYVVSAAAHDFSCSEDAGAGSETVFETAWKQDSNKRFQVLLTDPCCVLIRKRNARLNDRHIQYYIMPYLKILFLWESENISGNKRMQLRFHDELDYRCVLSRNRLVLQRYAYFRHGWKDSPILLHRVHFTGKLESELRQLKRCDLVSNACALEGWETVDQSRIFVREHKSIFEYYRKTVESKFKLAPPEKFLDEWDINRLRNLARFCHINPKLVNPVGSDNAGLAELICDELGLSGKYKSLRSY